MKNVHTFYKDNSKKYIDFERAIDRDPVAYDKLTSLRKKESDLLKHSGGKKVFYLATGSGVHVSTLLKSGASVVTVDFSEEMVNEAVEEFKRNKFLNYKVIKKNILSAEELDKYRSEKINPLVLLADYNLVELPKNYFDECFCYCTIPLLQDKWKKGLEKLLDVAESGVISIYNQDTIHELEDYYEKAGFEATVDGNVIRKEGGFCYECLDPKEIAAIITPRKEMRVENLGIGSLYFWSPKK
jgi:hypothetical protein